MQSQSMHKEAAPQGRSGLTVSVPCTEAPSVAGHVNTTSPVLARVRINIAQSQAAIAIIHTWSMQLTAMFIHVHSAGDSLPSPTIPVSRPD